jgi:DNA-binding beta-propeller fold protein YncE
LKKGGFDHAAVHNKSGILYVAHTANDSIDLIDTHIDKYLHSIPNLTGVAGVLVSSESDLVFTSNRGEKTVGVFPHGQEKKLEKVRVGGDPNGLAFDASQDNLLAANVSRADDPVPITASIVDVKKNILTADILMPGRTRWAVFDKKAERFYINIANPPQIVAVVSLDPDGVAASYDIPAAGPHGLDIDVEGRRLFCACDQGVLLTVDLHTRKTSQPSDLSGPPDVIFYNSRRKHLYVASGHPGTIDVFDTNSMKRVQTVKTEAGAHTIGYNAESDKVYAFLPETHRASIYVDE